MFKKTNYKFKLRKIVLNTILCIAAILLCSTSAYADDNDDIRISYQIPLYDNNDNVNAHYFGLSNGGYVITNSDGKELIEFTLNKSNINLDSGKIYYYSGPGELFEKSDSNTVKGMNSKEIISRDKIRCEIKDDNNKDNAMKAREKVDDLLSSENKDSYGMKVSDKDKLEHSTKRFDYNPDGRCGAVAAAIAMRYYDDYICPKCVRGDEKTANCEKLINVFVGSYLGLSTNYSTFENGLTRYLSDRHVKSKAYCLLGKNSSTVFSKIRSYIKRNRPIIVGLKNHYKYGNHWVVGTGYIITSHPITGKSYFVNVNDGWGNVNVCINNLYIDGCVYVK